MFRTLPAPNRPTAKSLLPFVSAAALALSAPAASAAVDLDDEEFRLYCGYLDALASPDIQKLQGQARDKKIANQAKVKPAVLMSAVGKGEKVGATCDEVGKTAAAAAKKGVDAALPGRIVVFNFDDSDPAHVVAQVTWLGVDKRKILEEAATLAAVVAQEAKIVKTIAIRAVDPSATDKLAAEAMWWEAKITRGQASRIDRTKIADYAATRYVRLFDGCQTTVEDACAKK